MSLSKNELLYLMAYVDGEVDDDELPEVLALIEKSEEARQIVAQEVALADWVRADADAHATAGRADGIAESVMKRIDAEGGAKIITLERQRAKRELDRQRVKEFGALAAVAAAIALFYLWPSTPDRVAQGPNPDAVQSAAPVAPAPPSAAPAPSAAPEPSAVAANEGEIPAIDVQAVESPQHQFSIFYVPAGTGANPHASSVVVWIGEE